MKSMYAPRSFATLALMLSIPFAGTGEVSAQGGRRDLNIGGMNIRGPNVNMPNLPRPQFDPFHNTGLENGGWQNGIIPTPRPTTSTVWPTTGNPSISHGNKPIQNPIYPTGPISTKPYYFPPGTVISPKPTPTGNPLILNSNPGIQGGNPGFQGGNPGFQGGNPDFQGGNPDFQGGNPGFQGGDPGNPGPAVPAGPEGQNTGQTLTADQLAAGLAVPAGPEGGNQSVVNGGNAGNPPGNAGMPGGDPAGPGDPGPGPGQGTFPNVVVVNQTGLPLAIAAKFVDPNTRQWIVAFNNSVGPGQAVQLGYTNNGTIYLHAEFTNESGQVVTVLEGSDTSFDTPRGALGMAQGNFTQQGNNLVSIIATQ